MSLSPLKSAKSFIKIKKKRFKKERLERETEESKLNKETMDVEHKAIDSVRKIDRIELRKSTDNIHHVIRLQNSPKPPPPQQQQQQQQPFTNPNDKDKAKDSFPMDNMDEFKKLSASSIQSQLENTIRLNQQNSKPISVVTAATPASAPTQEEQTNAPQISPNKNKTILKRPRKSSSGISPTGANTVSPTTETNNQISQQQTNQASNNSFTIDMDDIFATVLSNANKEETKPDDSKAPENSVKTSDVSLKMFLIENDYTVSTR